MANYPDVEGFGYSFQRAELVLAGRIFTAIANVSVSQPTEEAAIMGTRPHPIGRTMGQMELGEGSVEWTDAGELAEFIELLGDNYREKTWSLSWILTSPNRPSIKHACAGCRLLNESVDHEGGPDALGGEIEFSFVSKTYNNKAPHSGMPTR